MKKDQKPNESDVQSTLSKLSGKQSNGPEQRKDRRHKKPMLSWQDEAVLGFLRDIAYEQRTTQQSLIAEGLNYVLVKYKKLPIAKVES
jgi:hypothetical protein